MKNLFESKSNLMFYVIALLTIVVAVWLTVAEIDQVVRAQAEVEPPERVQSVQARFAGKVSTISVDVGDAVVEGQLLVELNGADIEAKVAQNRLIIQSSESEIARLMAEATGKKTLTIDAGIGSPETRMEQEGLFLARRLELDSERTLVSQQILRLEASILESQARIGSAQRRLKLIIEEQAIFEPLVVEGIEPRVRLIEIQGRREEAESVIEVEQLAIRGRSIEKIELQKKLEQLQRAFESDARQRLAEIRKNYDQALAEQYSLDDRLSATKIVSVVDGIVSAVYPNGAGAVVSSGEVLLDVVPRSDAFLVKARIEPKDISTVTIGQRARVSFTAYDFSKYGVLEAEVVNIAQNVTETERGESFYEAWVRTTEIAFAKSGIKPKIIPGMAAQVDILGEKRTVMEYIMSPILQTADRALTEQ
jgi:HlyD family type I secretion membrane fusion protein